MEFNRQRVIERRTTATEVYPVALPIGPLSHLTLTIDFWNATDEATLAELIAFLNNVQVTHHGVGVLDLQSEDLYGLNAYLLRHLPELTQPLATDNLHRSLTLIIPFGRKLFNPDECFPATKKGELICRVDTTVPATSADNSTWSLDAVELIGANPTHHLKALRKAVSAPGATGEFELELPLGNRIVAIQYRLVTVPQASSHTFGIDSAKLMVNNKEYAYTSADMMCLMGERMLRIGGPNATIAALGASPLNLIAWMDFDPNGDDEWLIDTAGKDSVKLANTYGVNEAMNLTPIELAAV